MVDGVATTGSQGGEPVTNVTLAASEQLCGLALANGERAYTKYLKLTMLFPTLNGQPDVGTYCASEECPMSCADGGTAVAVKVRKFKTGSHCSGDAPAGS
jgi:hypothetical protein